MSEAVVITGHCGGLGQAMARRLSEAGYLVIGIDLKTDPDVSFPQLAVDLGLLRDLSTQKPLAAEIRSLLPEGRLKALINNAATQVVDSLENLRTTDLLSSLEINAVAPLVLGQLLLDALERGKGTILNISSVHTRQTKRRFGAYSISKSALSATTRSMAIEWGARIRVLELCPAAISTDMLEAGFSGQPESRRLLDSYHPSGRIGTPEEVARIVQQLIELDVAFLNGAVVNVDGGISHMLHDPDF